MIDPGLLQTGLMVMLLMLMMTNQTLNMKRNGLLLKTGNVRMNPMISGIIQMKTCSDDIEPNDIEDEARDHIMALQCPTGGRDNILREVSCGANDQC